MYYAVIQQFARTLHNLDAILGKTVQYAESRKFNPDNFCTARVAPDMLPFTRQVQIACDTAKRTAASLTGKEAPVHEDTETTIAQLRERIAKVTAYLGTFTAEDFKSVTDKTVIKMPNPPAKGLHAPDALLRRAVPNFFFHVTTTYLILRAGGVDVGKQDFLGDLQYVDL